MKLGFEPIKVKNKSEKTEKLLLGRKRPMKENDFGLVAGSSVSKKQKKSVCRVSPPKRVSRSYKSSSSSETYVRISGR